MKYIEQASKIRASIKSKQCQIEGKPGIYRWWFELDMAKTLLGKIKFSDIGKLHSKDIGGKSYVALYFGISKDMKARAKWHICQKHSKSQVNHGALSTLRQTLSALLGIDMTKSMQEVNELIDSCYWEWDYVEDPKTCENTELKEQTDYAYPLNIQENRTVEKEVLSELKKLRKKFKI